jgi:hypothetical protein
MHELARHAEVLTADISAVNFIQDHQLIGNSADDTNTHVNPVMKQSTALTFQCRKLRCRLPVNIAMTARFALSLLRSSVCHTWSALPMSCSSLCLCAATGIAPAFQATVELSWCCV